MTSNTSSPKSHDYTDVLKNSILVILLFNLSMHLFQIERDQILFDFFIFWWSKFKDNYKNDKNLMDLLLLYNKKGEKAKTQTLIIKSMWHAKVRQVFPQNYPTCGFWLIINC
jgi:hypothetical protein